MPSTDSIRDTLEQLRAQEKKMSDDLNGLRFTIRSLERIAGIESPNAPSIENLADTISTGNRQEVAISNGTAVAGKIMIRPDEFFGLTHAEAARRYLKRVGHAVSFAEMVDVLRRGGCKLTSADPEHVLWISLIKNSKDFVPPQAGYVGLREFYPARAKAIAEKTKVKTKKRARTKKTKAVKQSDRDSKDEEKRKLIPDTNQKQQPNPVGQAVREFMSDKQPHSPEDVAKAVSDKLGRPVRVIAIRGTLNSKQFEETDGKFRLIS
jgi:hypothetical protein